MTWTGCKGPGVLHFEVFLVNDMILALHLGVGRPLKRGGGVGQNVWGYRKCPKPGSNSAMLASLRRLEVVGKWMKNWILITMLILGAMSMPILGSGFGLYEQGAQSMGSLGAFTARAEGASALYHNPAGLAQLKMSEFSISLRPMGSRSFYSNPGQSTWKTDPEFNSAYNMFGSFNMGRFALGVGSYASHQYKLDWDEADFPARFLDKETEFEAFEHSVGIGYRVTERFSIGGTYRFAQVDTSQSRVLVRPMDESDSSLSYETLETFSSDGDGSGFSLGLQYYRARRFSLGATYWSSIKVDLTGSRDYALYSRLNDVRAQDRFIENFNSAPLTTSFELPERIAIGIASRLTVRTRLELDISMEKWSSNVATVYNTQDSNGVAEQVVFPRNWEDSMSFRLAGDFQQRKALLWRAAIASVEGVVPVETASPYFPDDDRFLYSFGVSYTWRQKYIFEAAWQYIQNRDRDAVNQEFLFDPNAPNNISPTGEDGLYETQRTQFNFGVRIKFGKSRSASS